MEEQGKEKPLTPQELITMREGQRMLSAIQAQNPAQTAILGPDGLPISPPKVDGGQKPGDPVQVVVNNPDPQTVKDGLIASRMKRLNDNREVIVKMAEGTKEIGDVLKIMYGCHQLLWWARMELATHDPMTDELIEDADNIVKLGIYQDTRGFSLREVHTMMKTKYLPLVNDFCRKYADAQRVRRNLIKEVKRRITGEGITLPGTAMRKAMQGAPFMPGRTFIVHGKQEATKEALRVIAACHHKGDNGKCAVFSLALKVEAPDNDNADIIMPVGWWRNCGASIAKLYEVLEPVIKSKALLLLVEDLEHVFTSGEDNEPVHVRKSFAIKRLHQWAVENLVAVVIADDPGDVSFNYHPIPSLPVKIEGDSLFIGDEKFVNGEPVLPPKEEEKKECPSEKSTSASQPDQSQAPTS